MKSSESIASLAAALVAAQGEVKSISKDSKNTHFGNDYVSLDALTEAIRPVLTKHGLALLQGATVPHTDEHGALKALTVESMLLHSSGEWLSNAVVMPVSVVPSKNKAGEIVSADPTAQTAGSAVTYGRRYGLAALLALTTDDDDDGEAASQPARQATQKPAAEKIMPIGNTKGKKLGDLSDEELTGAMKWCKEKDEKGFKSLIDAIEEVLEERRLV